MKLKQKEFIITLLVVLVSFLIRLYRLDIPHDWSFDEVYHSLSAEAYALNDPRGYEWWNASPKDLAYEWLHPPLGKVFMAASIKLFAKPYIPAAKSDPVGGATTFAWRFPGTIFAAFTVWLLIIFGTKLFNNFWIGVVAGSLYGLDGLSFVQSRTGMNDIYITFFVVLVFYRLFRLMHDYSSSGVDVISNGVRNLGSKATENKVRFARSLVNTQDDSKRSKTIINLLYLGIASGLAASTKWTGFYAVGIVFVWGVVFLLKKRGLLLLVWGGFFAGIIFKLLNNFSVTFTQLGATVGMWALFAAVGAVIILLWGNSEKSKAIWTVVALGVIPVLVYFLSYSQWWWQGHTLEKFYELHQQIWWYQTGLKATHGYQSQAYTWPFLYRPVWFYVKYEDVVKNGVKELYIGNIYTMGHPFIWWVGLIAIIYFFWRWFVLNFS